MMIRKHVVKYDHGRWPVWVWGCAVIGCLMQSIMGLATVNASGSTLSGAVAGASIDLVIDGETSAAVIVPADAPQSLRNAVDDLVRYISC